MIIFLFGMGNKENCVVITKELYEYAKRTNRFYELKRALSPNLGTTIYTHFITSESFLTDYPLDEKDKKNAEKFKKKLLITQDHAYELTLAKKLNCPLVISDKQLWLTNAAKKIGVETKLY